MKNEVVWAIRDARGLSQDEKALLWAIESCGVAIKRWNTLAEDAGMKKDRFYRARKSLQEKGLILIVRKYDDVSEYTVSLSCLQRYLPHSHTENGHSHSAKEDSHSENPQLQMSETKKNMKKNEKEEREEEHTTGEPVVDEDSEVRTDEESFLIDETTSADSPSAGSRDAAQVEQNMKVANDVAIWHSW